MTEKSYAERIRSAVQSLHDQNTTAIKLCLKAVWEILGDVKDEQDAIAADRAQWEQERASWIREKNLLQSAARAAEHREGKIQDQLELERRRHADEMQQASDEISRLRGVIDISAGALQSAQEGASVERRIASGLPAFQMPVATPNRPERGYVYASIRQDLAENASALLASDNQYNPFNPLPALAELAKDHRPVVVDTAKRSKDIPVVQVTPEARELAGAGT